MILLLTVLVSLGNKPWCSVYPKRDCYFCVQNDNSKGSSYCVWDSKEECEKNKSSSDERCEPKENK